MTKRFVLSLANEFVRFLRKTISNATFRAVILSFIFLVSGIGASALMSPVSAATNNSRGASMAASLAPLSQGEANWQYPNGINNWNYNPQHVINGSSAQFLGINWLYPLPNAPSSLGIIPLGTLHVGVGTAPLIVNGTIYAVAQFGEIFALNAANGNLLWSDILPIKPTATLGIKGCCGANGLSFHMHDGDEQFTTKAMGPLISGPTLWISAVDFKVYAINAVTGKYELNFSDFSGVDTVPGNQPNAIESHAANILVDQNKGIVISSVESGSSPATGRCMFRGWNVLMNPPQLMWTAFCTPPQPNSNIPLDPNWDVKQVNNMTGAQVFYPGPAYNGGGPIPSTAVVDLKKISQSQLNASLYNDWGYLNQSPQCQAATGGSSTGSTAAGWGSAWLLGSGATAGMAFLPTDNRDPYAGPCMPGPDLWVASILAINETNGNWIWGFQTMAHEMWDWDCSWWQAQGNETVNGVNTPVVWKTCKNGYLYELNAKTGSMIWAWVPPTTIEPRCQYCYPISPLNSTQMNQAFFNPSLQPTVMYPGLGAGFESEQAYDPNLNYIFAGAQSSGMFVKYLGFNSSVYLTGTVMSYTPITGAANNNSTVFAINANTGQEVWHYFVPGQGYRGTVTTSGGLVFVGESSGDLLILNAATGKLVRDYYIGGPLQIIPTVGATVGGQMEVIVPIGGGYQLSITTPGDIVALSLQNFLAGGGSTTVTTTQTTTSVSTSVSTTTLGGAGAVTTTVTTGAPTVTVTGSTTTVAGGTTTVTAGGIDPTVTYGIAAVAVIFIIATGFFAMRSRRKPAT